MKSIKSSLILGMVAVLALAAGPAAFAQGVLFVTGGNVGIGIDTPTQPLQLNRADGSQQVLVESGAASAKSMMVLRKPGSVKFELQNTNTGNAWFFSANTQNEFTVSLFGTGGPELTIDAAGNAEVRGNLVTGGGGTCDPGPCDGTFDPAVYQVESIEEHAKYMWENKHLWGVGPTPEGEPLNLSKKTTGILHELEKAHIYIEQLHNRLERLEQQLANGG